MTDHELEEIIQVIYQSELERAQDDGLEESFMADHDLRPPASAQDITDCEKFLGRQFSPSYRHFLSLHDGWKGFYRECGVGYLYGTHHYRLDQIAREDFALNVYVHLQAARSPEPLSIPDQPHYIYYPENYYHFIDGKLPVTEELKSARELIDSYNEEEEIFPVWKHTLLGGETHYRLILDINTLSWDGEMEAVEQVDANEERWENFYEFLKDCAEW